MSILLCILLTALSLQLASCKAEIDTSIHEPQAKSSQDVGKNFNPLFPIQGLNSVLKSITDLKKQKTQLKTKTKRPNAKPKIACKGVKDLIVVLDNTKNVGSEDFYQLLDFVGNITRFWRRNKQCRISFIPQAAKMEEAGAKPIKFADTMKYGDWQLLATVYSMKQIDEPKDSISEAMKTAKTEFPAMEHEPEMEKNVLFISTTGPAPGKEQTNAIDAIEELLQTPKVKTFAIGVRRPEPASQIQLETILGNFTMNKERRLKWIDSFNDLQVNYDFVATNLL